eukprot:TRINITY_DN2399_c0_g2_i3.p3 TRINITY_DN2399_c0_g2~~TRINITY_DN2399_c0_g2_i3.p3  ORF type:complete len:106 (+),score=5.66 TRINITY_DN2399_c0_g2_i3:574-891(+)
MAKAKHVICVRRDAKIEDNAAKKFEQAFYHALFVGTLSTCEAFKSAKAQLKMDSQIAENEEEKFQILTQSHLDHHCEPLVRIPEGSCINLYPEPRFRHSIPFQCG